MRILIIGNLYPPVVFGGYEILCRQVVEKLESRGHTVRVLTSSFGKDTASSEDGTSRTLALTTPFPKPGEQVGFVDFRLLSIERVAKKNRSLTLAEIDSFRPDLVFCWCMNRLSLGPIFACQERGVPVCYTINDEHPKQFHCVQQFDSPRVMARYLTERLVWKHSTFRGLKPFPIMIISEALKQSLLEKDVPIDHAEVIYQGVPVESLPFRPTPRVAGEPWRILYVGQLSRVKGVHTILHALSRLERHSNTPVHLDIVGKGVPDYEKELHNIVKSEGLDGRVSFLGHVPHEKIAPVYASHHILVFSSEWAEPFGLTHLEAMASGCAVVSTTRGGCRELIKDRDNARAFKAGDPADLANKLRELTENEGERIRMIQRARSSVEHTYSLDAYVDRIERFLRDRVCNRDAA